MDHFEQYLRVGFPWLDKPRFATLMVPFLQECQELDDLFVTLQTIYDVDFADFERLSVLAGLLGQEVITQDLEELRKLVKCKAIINQSRGARDDLAKVLAILFPSPFSAFAYAEFAAGIEILVDGSGIFTLPSWYSEIIRAVTGAGLTVRWMHRNSPGAPFMFGGTGFGWTASFAPLVTA